MRGGGEDDAVSSDIQPWELDHVRRVAARFPDIETDELAAELGVTLLALKRQQLGHVRDWKAYLTQVLFHRASALARRHRRQRQRETHMAELPDAAEVLEPSEGNVAPRTRLHLIRLFRRVLDAKSFEVARLMLELNFNQSRVAKALRVHRNTIRRCWADVQKELRKCPIEMYSAAQTTVVLTPSQEAELQRFTSAGRGPLARRARIILALAGGRSYRQIQKQYGVTARTIALWKFRLVMNGTAGLRSIHRGRPAQRAQLLGWLQRNPRAFDGVKWSCRKLARRFGFGKSTVQRILRTPRKA